VQTLTSPDQIKCTRVGFQTRPKLENPNHEQPERTITTRAVYR
jgi:hypothetical protein